MFILKEQEKKLLDSTQTQLFLDRMDGAIRHNSYISIENCIAEYFPEKKETYKEFLEVAFDNTTRWILDNRKKYIIKSSFKPYDSHCTFCYFGVKMRAYHMEYYQHHLPQVVYSRHIALHYKINDSALVGFNWCTAHHSRQEMRELGQ